MFLGNRKFDYYEHLKTLPVLKEPSIMIFGKIAKQNSFRMVKARFF